MSAQLSLPGVKWPPPPRPPPRLPEKRLPRPIAPILGSPRPSSNSEGCVVGRENLYGAIALLAPIAWPEPFGLVLIEAMACGTSVIAFNRGSVPEIVEDGLTGFIVERKEEAVAATDQLSRLSRGAIRWRFEERFTARRIVCPWRTLPCPVMGRPPEFLQPLAQGRNACLSVRIVRSQHYYGEAPPTLGQDRRSGRFPRAT